MSAAFLSFQLLLTLVVLGAVIQRCAVLLFQAPASAPLVDAWCAALASGDAGHLRRLVDAAPRRWGSRLVAATLESRADRDESVDMVLAELRMEAEAQLGLIRVSATLASTLGLLGGIIAIQRGFSGQGLLALRAGLAQQVALSQALSHMAVGIGTAAFCFSAFGLLRGAARDLVAQASHIAARCRLGADPDVPPTAASFTSVSSE